MPVLEIVGWIGSALVVLSLMQARVWRFRWLNLIGSTIATVYNVIVEIWPFAAMNGVIAVINVYWLWRLNRERHDAAVYEVVPVGAGDRYLRHVLGVHAADIARYFPSFAAAGGAQGPRSGSGSPERATGEPGEPSAAPSPPAPSVTVPPVSGASVPGRWAYLVLRGDETVGMVVVRDEGAGVGEVELDYVTPRFRDFTPGEFVYGRSGVFAGTGLRSLVVVDDARDSGDYLERVGFERVGGRWRRDVEPATA